MYSFYYFAKMIKVCSKRFCFFSILQLWYSGV